MDNCHRFYTVEDRSFVYRIGRDGVYVAYSIEEGFYKTYWEPEKLFKTYNLEQINESEVALIL